MELTEKTYGTPGGRIRYWISPSRAGLPWLVFLPGLTADHHLFDKQLEGLGEAFNCLAWDAPAHGGSRPFALSFSMGDLVGWLHAILQQEHVHRPVLVGQSMGGCVAQAYLEGYPQGAAGLVCIDAPPLGRRYYTRPELWLLRHTKWMYRSIPWGWLQRQGAAGTAESPYGKGLMRHMMAGYQKKEYCALATHGYRLLAQAVGAYRGPLPCPALLLCGEKDNAGSCRRYDRRWAQREGLPLVWVPGAGHNANTDQPAFVNQRIAQFCMGLDAAGKDS